VRQRSEICTEPGARRRAEVAALWSGLGAGRIVEAVHASRLISTLLAMLVLEGLVATSSVGAVPKAPSRFWSVAHCEQVLPEEHPAIIQLICVGSGDASACRWRSDHKVRLYSELTVLAWYRHANFTSIGMHGLEPGVVRSFTLATRAHPGFVRIIHQYGDAYVGWPADFFMAHVRLVGTHVSKAGFRAFVAPIAVKLAQSEKTTNCTGT
jgi:hypothetical protein